MLDANRLYLSKDFPEPLPCGMKAGPCSVIVQAVEFTERNGVLVAGTGEQNYTLDQDAWESPIGQEFRDLCDTYWELERAILNGCPGDQVKQAYEATKGRLWELQQILRIVSYDDQKKSELTPDVGIVVSVGKHHSDKFQIGDKVAMRPGDMYLQDEDGPPYRVIKDQYDPHTGDFLYDVTDSIPVKLTSDGVQCLGEWALVRRIKKENEILLKNDVYTDQVEVWGQKAYFKPQNPDDMLTFKDPEDWGLTKDHCVVKASRLISAVS